MPEPIEKEEKKETENPLTWLEGNIKNPEGGSNLDQDTFDKINKGELSMDDLSQDQLVDYRNELASANERVLSGKEQNLPPEDKPDDKKPDDKTEEPDKKEDKSDKITLFDKFKKKSDDLNTLTQRHANLEKNFDKIKKELDEHKKRTKEISEKKITKPDDAEDYLQDENQKALLEKVDKLELMVSALQTTIENTTGAVSEQLQGDMNNLKTQAESLKEEAGDYAILNFQESTANKEKFPFKDLDLKTTVPVKQLDAELAEFKEKIGGMDKVNDYLTDENFKKEMDEKGISLKEHFIKNVPKYNEILVCNKLVADGEYPDHMSAYMNRLYESGRLSKAQIDAKLEGSNAAIEKVSSDASKTQLIPADKGGKGTSPKWTVTSALKWIREHPDIRRGSEEEKTRKEILDLIKENQRNPGTLQLT